MGNLTLKYDDIKKIFMQKGETLKNSVVTKKM